MTDIPDDVRAWLVRLDLAQVGIGERLEALESALANATATNDLTSTTAPINWQYRSVYDWVEQWFAVTFRRNVAGGTRWCSQWWAHEEALLLLTALWRTWEAARLDTTAGIARWLTATAYPLLDRLWSSDGTFRMCSVERCRPSSPLICAPKPEGDNNV